MCTWQMVKEKIKQEEEKGEKNQYMTIWVGKKKTLSISLSPP